MRKGEKVDYTSYKPLKEAIESYLISSVKDIARIVTKSKTRDDEQRNKLYRNIFSAGQLGIVEKTGADDLQTQADRSAQVSREWEK